MAWQYSFSSEKHLMCATLAGISNSISSTVPEEHFLLCHCLSVDRCVIHILQPICFSCLCLQGVQDNMF